MKGSVFFLLDQQVGLTRIAAHQRHLAARSRGQLEEYIAIEMFLLEISLSWVWLVQLLTHDYLKELLHLYIMNIDELCQLFKYITSKLLGVNIGHFTHHNYSV